MNYQYFIADVFTRDVFNGAQIAVFPNAAGLSDEQMRKVANEINLWETVFISPSDSGSTHRIRIFSPKHEVDFAGHPIIAAAFILGSSGGMTLNEGMTPLVFEQNTGPVEVNITAENGKPVFVQFSNKVTSIIDRFTPSDEEMAALLSVQQSELDHIKYSARLVACGMPYLIVPVWKYDSVRKARFNYAAWSQSTAPQTAAQEILLFAPKTPYPDSDFNLRLLGPHIGHDDDPPVGSAIPAFASYLCSFDSTPKGTHVFTIDRGDAQSRRSVINVEMDHKGKAQLSVRVGGSAVIFAQGTIYLPD